MAEKNIAIDLDNPNIAFSMKMVETNPFMQWNGIAVEELDEDHCVCAMELRPEQTNPNGYAHGGVLFTIADVTASALARADGRNYSTLDSDVHFLRNVKEGRIVGEDVYTARTYMDAPGVDGTLFIETRRELMSGDFVTVKITGSDQYDLVHVRPSVLRTVRTRPVPSRKRSSCKSRPRSSR